MTLAILLLFSLLWGGEPLPDMTECVWQNVTTTVALVPAIAEQPSQAQKKRIFYATRLTVNYQPGQQVLLIPLTPEAGLFVDDFLQITDSTSAKSYRHDFRSPDRRQVVPVTTAVDLSDLFVPGDNQIEVFTQDLTPPRYSTKGMALALVGACVPATPTPLPTLPPPPTFTPLPLPTATPWPTATATDTPQPTHTPLPAATATLLPTATPSPIPPTPTVISVRVQKAATTRWPISRISLFVLVVAGLVTLWTRSQQIKVPGQLMVYAGEKKLRTVDLAEQSESVIFLDAAGNSVDKQQLATLPYSARIWTEQDEDGQPAVMVELLALVEPQLAGTEQRSQLQVIDKRRLQHNDVVSVGTYRWIYQYYQ
jgi:hypothetical protein